MAGDVVDLGEVRAAFDVVDAALDKVGGPNCEALATPELLELLERCERVRRRLPSVEHPLINRACPPSHPRRAGRQAVACAGRLHADQPCRGLPAHQRGLRSGAAARADRRTDAAGIGRHCRRAAAGKLGAGHVAVIRRFWHHLPGLRRCRDPRARRSPPGAARLGVWPRTLDRTGRSAGRSAQPRRHLPRRRPYPAARAHAGSPDIDGMSQLHARLTPRGPRHPRSGPGQAGRARHVQPRR